MAGKSKEIDYRKKWHLQTGPSAQRSAERNKILAKIPKVQTTKKRADRVASTTASRASAGVNQMANTTSVYATRPAKARKKTTSSTSRGVKRRGKA